MLPNNPPQQPNAHYRRIVISSVYSQSLELRIAQDAPPPEEMGPQAAQSPRPIVELVPANPPAQPTKKCFFGLC